MKNLSVVVTTKKFSVPATQVMGGWRFSCTGKATIVTSEPTCTFSDVPYGTLNVTAARIDAAGSDVGGGVAKTVSNPAPIDPPVDVDVVSTITVTLS
jgi:hypothetical protein